ncbi:MAG: hypothetical protein IKY04_08725, partial [Lachnospiraceae bacterium]|nr:hypothetical protein [Lachnospiraceae bacterium]
MQIIVSRELPVSDYVWLKSLTKNGTLDNISGIIRKTKELDEKHKEYANNVMNVFTTGNADLMRRVKKEETVMCKAVEELFAEEHKKELEERDLALKESEEKITALTAKVEELSKLVEDLQSQIALG